MADQLLADSGILVVRTSDGVVSVREWLIEQIEKWAHNELDAKHKRQSETHRWLLCIPPSGDLDEFARRGMDCACCLMKPSEYRDTDCQCYCHERVRSLAAFIDDRLSM